MASSDLDADFLSLPVPQNDESDSESSIASDTPPFDPKGLPPWLLNTLPNEDEHPLVRLHNEIVQFSKLVQPTVSEMKVRTTVTSSISSIVESTFSGRRKIQVFGSSATGLLLPGSDVDIVCVMTDEEIERLKKEEGKGEEDTDVKKQSAMRSFADALLKEWGEDLIYLEVIEKTRIPIVKCTHGPSGISVDISFDLPTGPLAAKLMRYYLCKYPPLRPLTMALKQYLACRNLNQPYHGGIGSFTLQLMIVSMLQNRYKEDTLSGRPHVPNLGSMLMDFLEIYGINFNYASTGITLEEEGGYFEKAHDKLFDDWIQPNRLFCMAIENPLEPGMDVGKGSFRVGLCRRSFEISYKVVLSNILSPASPPLSILASIMPPEAWMAKRIRHFGMNQEVMKMWEWEGDDKGLKGVVGAEPVPVNNVLDKSKGDGKKKEAKKAKEKRPRKQESESEEEEGELDEVEEKLSKRPKVEARTSLPKPNIHTTISTKNLSFHIFMCNNKTHNECFERRLFGSITKSKAKAGDYCLLYNFNTKSFDGPFLAVTDTLYGIEKQAWGGSFQHQVRVTNVVNRNPSVNPYNNKLDFATIDKNTFENYVLGKAAKKTPTSLSSSNGLKFLKLCQSRGWGMGVEFVAYGLRDIEDKSEQIARKYSPKSSPQSSKYSTSL